MAKDENRYLYLISRSFSRLKYYSIQKFLDEDITVTPSQMGILFVLSKAKSMTMSELSTVLSVDNSTLTRLADKLVKQGFIERVRDSSDRRVLKIILTSTGIEEATRALKITRELNNEIIKDFSAEEIKIFVKILQSFLNKF